MLQLADALLFITHLVVIGFNLLGWIWRSTQRLHLLVAGITATCWLLLGIWFGIGYCPLTDLEWNVKYKLGETRLPASFIKYLAEQVGATGISALTIDYCTGIGFALAVFASIYVNVKRKSRLQHNQPGS